MRGPGIEASLRQRLGTRKCLGEGRGDGTENGGVEGRAGTGRCVEDRTAVRSRPLRSGILGRVLKRLLGRGRQREGYPSKSLVDLEWRQSEDRAVV